MGAFEDLLNVEFDSNVDISNYDALASIACPWCNGPMTKGDEEILGTCGICYSACCEMEVCYPSSFFFFPGRSKT